MVGEQLQLAIGIVLNENDELLLVERVKKMRLQDGNILDVTFPSGKIDFGEDPLKAAEREVKEETGCYTQASGIVHKGKHDFAPVMVHYVSCEFVEVDEAHVPDPVIERAFWVPRLLVKETVSTPINTHVMSYLGMQ